jgi:hypothetical protein
MKKILLTLIFGCWSMIGFSQSLLSITPNSSGIGQSISTVVTGDQFYFLLGSAPSTFDFYLQNGTTFIYPTSTSVIDNDNVLMNFNIPFNVPIGNYDATWNYGFPQYSVPGGFDIGGNALSGVIYHDADSNGVQNGSEIGLSGQTVLLLPDSIYTSSNTNGNYYISSQNGNKTLKVVPTAVWLPSGTSQYNLNLITYSVVDTLDFGLKPTNPLYSIDVSLTSISLPRCFSTANYRITYKNDGNFTFPQGQIVLNLDTACTYAGASVVPDNIAGDVFTWNYLSLLPGETRTIDLQITLPGPNSVINNTVNANGEDAGGAIQDTDGQTYTQTVLCSYDPNDKTVIPPGVQAQHFTLMSDTLDFVIRFQNTGNDTAFKIVILDTLNGAILDLNTFQIIDQSHPVLVERKTNGEVRFIFNNILLPDSIVNEPASHGFIRYRCMPKTGLPDYSILNNRAHIYFDFNPAIVTNTTLNILVYQIPVGLAEQNASNNVVVIPNPVTENALISFENLNNEAYTVKVYDTTGRLLFIENTRDNKVIVSENVLSTGVYIYEVTKTSTSETTKGKFVVL